MTEQELLLAHGMGRHELRIYEGDDGGYGCSCGKEYRHERDQRHRQHTASDPEPGCEFCEPAK